MPLTKQAAFTKKVTDLPDKPSPAYTATDIKSHFQTPADELMATVNKLIDDLQSIVSGSSGADNIGATAITDLTGTNVQSLLKSLRDKLKSVTDGSSGADFVNATGITGLTGTTVQGLLESLKSYADAINTNSTGLNTHKTATELDHPDASVTTRKLANGSVTRQKVATGAIGTNELDPAIFSQPTTVEGVQAKFQSVDEQLADITTIAPNGTDDTTNIQSVLDSGKVVRLIQGTYIVSSLIFNDFAKVISSGYKTIIKQKSGVVSGTRIMNVQGHGVEIDEMTYEGNISTDTGEQNHAVFIKSTVKSIYDVVIKGIRAFNIRGDALYIGGNTDYNPQNFKIGNVFADNCYRNGVSITGGSGKVGDILALRCGVLGLDLESDTQGGSNNIITIGRVITSNVGILASGGSYPYTQNVTIDFIECRKSRAGSTPDYPSVDTDKDGITFRNAQNIKIKGLDIDGFDRFAINFLFTTGDRYSDNIEIDSLTVANCSLNDATYNSYVNMAGVQMVKIGHVKSTVQTGKVLFKGTSKTANEQNVIIGSCKHTGGLFANYCGLYASNLDVVSDTTVVSSIKNLSRIILSKLQGTTLIGYSDNVMVEGCTLTYTTKETGGVNIYKNNVINGVFTA